MAGDSGSPALLERYLSLLGATPQPPTPAFLSELVRRQLVHVPFENISKLYRVRQLGLRTMPTLEEHLEGIEACHFGGTCYANNWYFCWLLRLLGFDATLCGADMSRPDVHVVVVVRLDDREYLADVGYAAPFYEPLPRDLETEVEIAFGNERYVLAPQDEWGRSRVDHYRDEVLIHGYLAKPQPRDIGFFSEVVRASYDDSASFMNAIMLRRFWPERSITLYNESLIVATRDRVARRKLAGRPAILDAVHSYFEIPESVIDKATTGLGALTGVHG